MFANALRNIKSYLQNILYEDEYDVTSSPSVNRLNALLEEMPISSLLKYEYVDEDDIFYNIDSCGFIIEAVPMCGAEQQAIESFETLINEKLPEGTSIHFTLLSTANIDRHLNAFKNHRSIRAGIYADTAEKRVEHIHGKNKTSLLKSENYIMKDFRLYIDVTFDSDTQKKDIIISRNDLLSVLDAAGIKYRNLNAEELIVLVGEVISPYAGKSATQYNPFEPLKNQCAPAATSMVIGKNKVSINDGDTCIKSYSIQGYPSFWAPISMGEMIGDPFKHSQRLGFPFVISMLVHIPNQMKLSAEFTAKRVNALKTANAMGKFSRVIVDTAQDIDFMMKRYEEGQRLVKVSIDYLVYGNKDTIDQNGASLESLLDVKKWRYTRTRYTQLHALLRAMPMHVNTATYKSMSTFSIFRTLPTAAAINMLPLQGEAMGVPSPGILLGGRRGQMCFWEPFANEQGNYNAVVAASSGAGKSVFNQELMFSHLGSGGKAWIIDIGRSYYKLTKLLGGQFIEFSKDTKISLNPFSGIDDLHDPESDYMTLLIPLVAQMASPNQGLARVQLSEIEESINRCWRVLGNKMTITDVANDLTLADDPRANDIGKMLYRYTRKGMYGKYFDGPCTLNFNSDLICLELEELNGKSDLQSVVLMLLMYQMTQAMYLGDRKTKITCLIDEAWQLLENVQGSSFIATGFRRARKYNGNFVICTQSIEDCFTSVAGTAAYNNSDWVVLLRHKGEAIKSVVRSGKLDVDAHQLKIAQSLEKRDGEFSEVMIKGPAYNFSGRLILDPFSAELFTTKGEDFAKVKDLMDAGIPVGEALNQIIFSKEEVRRAV